MNNEQSHLMQGATILKIENNSDTEVTIITSKGEIYISLDHSSDETGVDYSCPFLTIDLYDEHGEEMKA